MSAKKKKINTIIHFTISGALVLCHPSDNKQIKRKSDYLRTIVPAGVQECLACLEFTRGPDQWEKDTYTATTVHVSLFIYQLIHPANNRLSIISSRALDSSPMINRKFVNVKI